MANEKVIEIAKKYVGVTEYPPNSNNVVFNTRFYGREVSGANYPWCCAFIWYIHNEAGVDIKKTASCAELGAWFKNNGKFKTSAPKVGDIVFFKLEMVTSKPLRATLPLTRKVHSLTAAWLLNARENSTAR